VSARQPLSLRSPGHVCVRNSQVGLELLVHNLNTSQVFLILRAQAKVEAKVEAKVVAKINTKVVAKVEAKVIAKIKAKVVG
jgi:hypothetical protein